MFFCPFLIAQNNVVGNSSREEKIKKILVYQDERKNQEIENFLKDTDSLVIRSAVVALANIQDTSSVSSLIKLYKESDTKSKSAILFALGQLGQNILSSQFLFEELKQRNETSLRCVLFESFGRVGTEPLLDSMIALQVNNNDEEIGKLWGVTRFALRGIKNKNSINYLFNKLNSGDEEILIRASYALWRSSVYALLKDYLPVLMDKIQMLSAPEKSYLINAMGPIPANDTIKQVLLKSFDNDLSDQLSALKVLEKYKLTKNEFDLLLNKPDFKDEHARLALFRLLSKSVSSDSIDKIYISGKIKNLLGAPGLSWRERAELYNALTVLTGDKCLDVLLKESKTKNERYNAKIIKTMGEVNSISALKTLLYKIKTSASLELISQVEAIAKLRIKIKCDSNDLVMVKKIYSKALNSKNIALITTTIMALNNLESIDLIPSPELVRIYKKLRLPDDIEGMVEFVNLFKNFKDAEVFKLLEKEVNSESRLISDAAINSLADLSNKEYIRTIDSTDLPKKTFYDWEYYSKLLNAPLFEITTEKGNIKIQLFPSEAPFTCISLCKLIDKKYYDGLVFHRVVSNFVIQGGDPLGNGWGGPGYSIRTENNPEKFGTGYLGMASAGRDTEGSQFFITHSPQPHLDGKYTVFGKVIEGMDVVNKIQEGDKMITVRRIK